MSVVLLTGFGAYEEEDHNPSGVIAANLDGDGEGAVRIRGLVLPVSSGRVASLLAEAIETIQPDVLLVTGVTPGRAAVAVERVAINVRDFPIPDVDGATLIDEPIVETGPAAYFSSLPIKAILSAWREKQIPSYVSNSAGTYLCNQIFYLARHLTVSRSIPAGLVHIPLPSGSVAAAQQPEPPLCMERLRDAVRTAALVAAKHSGPDLKLGAGTTS